MSTNRPQLTVATAPNPGAIGIVHLHGGDLPALLERLTGMGDWPLARMRLVRFGDLDQGLAVCLRHDWAQLMAHGGPRVMQLLVERLIDMGADCAAQPLPAWELYPEAASRLEADMLAAMARAASPAAIDVLLAQRALWCRWLRTPPPQRELPQQILARSVAYDRLLNPPSVVVVGRPNVGKSTLSNQMLGRSASIVADLPGTTRDWVAGLAELRPDPAGSDCGPAVETSICRDAVAVRWHDTPGLRRSEDLIEQQAIESVRHLIADADVVLAMRDLHTDWPLPTSMQRRPDLWLVNKIDLQMPAAMQGDGTTRNGALGISAVEGAGIDLLQQRVLATLDLKCVAEPRLWVFSNSLRLAVCDNGTEQLRDYVGL